MFQQEAAWKKWPKTEPQGSSCQMSPSFMKTLAVMLSSSTLLMFSHVLKTSEQKQLPKQERTRKMKFET